MTFMVPAARLCIPSLLLLLTGAQLAAAETATQPPPAQSQAASAGSSSSAATQTPPPPPPLPGDLEKIKEGVKVPSALSLVDKDQLRIYVHTTAPFPTFTDIVGDFDLRKGPVPYAGMTHQEFVQSTRPKDMYSSAGFTVGDVIRWGLLTYTEGKAFELLRNGVIALREAKTEADRRAIRARIEKELAALRGDIK